VVTDRIAPHIEAMVRTAGASTQQGLIRESMRANVRASIDHLRHGSRLLADLVLAGRVAIVGAEYELETGRVHFIDGVPHDRGGTDSPRE
jgi:carbonic anhydrase